MTSVLYSYLMTHDTGFAPNPFFGYLTLATCKPGIRRTKRPGQWVAGFVSAELAANSQRYGIAVPRGGLVYLMHISEVLTLDCYFHDPRFQQKKPVMFGSALRQSGDNIYRENGDGSFSQLRNVNHDKEHIADDTAGRFVLIAEEFYYFGRNAIMPPDSWAGMGIRIPVGQAPYGYGIDAAGLANLLALLRERGYEPGVHGQPSMWREAPVYEPSAACTDAHFPAHRPNRNAV